jgi:hypothetical protein
MIDLGHADLAAEEFEAHGISPNSVRVRSGL